MPIKVFLSAVVSTEKHWKRADQHRIETAIYAGVAIYASWKRDIVNGDAYSRAEYVGNVAAQIVIPYGEFKLALKISDISKVGRLKALGKLKAAKDKSVEFLQRVKRIRTAPKTIMITPDGLHVPANEFLSQEELWQRFANGPDARDVNHRIHGSGVKGKNGRKELAPNTRYITEESYVYTTDEFGRIVDVEADELILKKGTRNPRMQVVAGREDRLWDDDGGHLIGTQFHGSGDIDNLLAQNRKINRSGGEWYKMETEWANALKEIPPKKVSVKIKPIYSGPSLRPDSFKVVYVIEGKGIFKKTIENKPGG